jgi:hypothetical protein
MYGKLGGSVCIKLRFFYALHYAYINTDMTSDPLNQYENTGRIFTLLSGSKALRFMTTGAPPAARRIGILPMTQHA